MQKRVGIRAKAEIRRRMIKVPEETNASSVTRKATQSLIVQKSIRKIARKREFYDYKYRYSRSSKSSKSDIGNLKGKLRRPSPNWRQRLTS